MMLRVSALPWLPSQLTWAPNLGCFNPLQFQEVDEDWLSFDLYGIGNKASSCEVLLFPFSLLTDQACSSCKIKGYPVPDADSTYK